MDNVGASDLDLSVDGCVNENVPKVMKKADTSYRDLYLDSYYVSEILLKAKVLKNAHASHLDLTQPATERSR